MVHINETLDKVEGRMNTWGKNVGNIAKAAIGAFAGFEAVSFLKGAIDSTTQLGESVRKLSEDSGLGAEDASRLLYTFKQFGLTGDDATRSLGMLEKNMVNTVMSMERGMKVVSPFAESMKVLGVSFVGANGQMTGTATVLAQLADRFATMPDGPTKTALAMDIFGKSGKDMIPILNLGAAGMAAYAAEADKLGVTLSAENVAKIHEFELANKRLGAAFEGIKIQIAEAAMPYLEKFANWFTEHAGDIRKFVDEAIRTFGKLADDFVTGLGSIQKALSWIPDNQGTIIAAIAAIGVAMVIAFGPESVAIAGLVAMVTLIGQIKNAGIHFNLGPLGHLDIGGGGPAGPSELAQAYAAKGSLTGDNYGGTPQGLAMFNQSHPGAGLDQVQAIIDKLEGGAAGGQPIVDLGKKAADTTVDLGKLGAGATKATTQLVDVFKAQSAALAGALSKADAAISGLFSKPTIEQLNLQDQLANVPKLGSPTAVHFGGSLGTGTEAQLTARIQKQIDQLDSQHKAEQTHLQMLDATNISEKTQHDMYLELEKRIPTFTTNIKDAADRLNIHLTPGFDDLVRASDGFRGALNGPDGATSAVNGMTKAANDFVDYVRSLNDINSKPLHSPGSGNGPSLTDNLRSQGFAIGP